MSALRQLPYEMLPLLRSSNGPVFLHPDDRKYGVLAVGGQGSGKTSALLRLYLSDIRDPNACVIVMDPKSELARTCLELTPPDCPKRVWFLDLGRPRFGMSPLRLAAGKGLAEQASAIADNIVQAISDTAEGQVFQSSRRYLYHAVIGALALAQKHGGLAMFEDVFALLLPARNDLREQAVNACQEYADLDHTTEFFARVLPEELDNNRSNTYQRLDPPRNKIETILGSPALRRFFSNPIDVRLADIVHARDILLIDANMAGLGEEASLVAMQFFSQQLHAFMQGQMHLPWEQRARVCAIFEEAGKLAKRNLVNQAATHREARLELSIGLQYLSQLGAGADSASITDEIRKGVTNLFQSRFLFRLGEPEDAEAATRIAMSVYQTMIRADQDSRELLRITPEQALYLPVWHCVASWIAGGARAPSFIGQTYPFPRVNGGPWAEHHMRLLEEEVGPYPETLPKTYKRTGSSASTNDANSTPTAPTAPTGERPPVTHPAKGEQSPPVLAQDPAAPAPAPPRAKAAKPPAGKAITPAPGGAPKRPDTAASSERPDVEREHVQPLIREAGELPEVKRSPVRRVLGASPAPDGPQRLFNEDGGPESIRELAAYVDPLLGIRAVEEQPPSTRLPRLYSEDYAILALLDRVGLALPGMLRRAVMPKVAERTMRGRLHDKLHRHGLIARWPIVLRDAPRGSLPYLYSLTKFGMQVAQSRQPPAVPPSREFRQLEVEKAGPLRHNLHLLSWVIALHEQLGDYATDKWRTPRWPAGTCTVPQTGNGRNRHQITLKDIVRPKHIGIFDVQTSDFGRIEPDAICEIHIPEERLTIDLFIELDLTDRASYNIEKFRRYDAFLCGWWTEHRRYRQLRTRPGILFVCTTPEMAIAYARAADQTMAGSIGVTGSPAQDRYYPGRDHIFFATESDLHNGDLAALALPPLPPQLRNALEGASNLPLSRVRLFPEKLLSAARRRGTP
ncbi:MAG: replication-relaxation family protein [Solirubrobacteraceae bacterium]